MPNMESSSSINRVLSPCIMSAFQVDHREANNILEVDGAYFAHILTKGYKGNFSPVDKLFSLLNDNYKELSEIINKDESDCKNFHKFFKPALISKCSIIIEDAMQLFTKIN